MQKDKLDRLLLCTGGYTRLWGHEPPLLAIKQGVKQVTKAQQSVERILENRKCPDS